MERSLQIHLQPMLGQEPMRRLPFGRQIHESKMRGPKVTAKILVYSAPGLPFLWPFCFPSERVQYFAAI